MSMEDDIAEIERGRARWTYSDLLKKKYTLVFPAQIRNCSPVLGINEIIYLSVFFHPNGVFHVFEEMREPVPMPDHKYWGCDLVSECDKYLKLPHLCQGYFFNDEFTEERFIPYQEKYNFIYPEDSQVRPLVKAILEVERLYQEGY